MMRYLIDSILLRRRTVKRSTNDWDAAAYLEEEQEDSHQARLSRGALCNDTKNGCEGD